MEAGFRTLFLDIFKRGEVDRDIRLLAAQGALGVGAYEQLSLLMLLVRDQDPEIARVAEATLHATPPRALAAFLARSNVSMEVRAFFAERGIVPATEGSTDADPPLFAADTEPPAPVEETKEGSTLQKIAAMSPAQRLALAMRGTREERAILIRDPNKIVSAAVLSSPKITDAEVESIAKMANVSDEILRIIGHTRAWAKSYGVVVALTRNPKTPVAVSLNLLSRLNEKDMKMLSGDRNVPDAVRIAARKKMTPTK